MIAVESITMLVAEALDKCSIPYLLVGAFSSNHYGIPRSTKDADFVLQVSGGISSDLVRELGPDFELNPRLSFETNTGTYRQILQYSGRPFTVELFLLSNDPHDQERFRRRRKVQLLGRPVWFPSPEDVIVTKLRWSRSKDKDDVRNVLAVQRGKLDLAYIKNWCREHGTLTRLEEILRTVPEI